VFVLGHQSALKKKKKAIDIKPTGETRYCLSWVHKRTISVHFTANIRGTLQKETTLLDWEKGANVLKGCPDE
jgi:hypothetical protein